MDWLRGVLRRIRRAVYVLRANTNVQPDGSFGSGFRKGLVALWIAGFCAEIRWALADPDIAWWGAWLSGYKGGHTGTAGNAVAKTGGGVGLTLSLWPVRLEFVIGRLAIG